MVLFVPPLDGRSPDIRRDDSRREPNPIKTRSPGAAMPTWRSRSRLFPDLWKLPPKDPEREAEAEAEAVVGAGVVAEKLVELELEFW